MHRPGSAKGQRCFAMAWGQRSRKGGRWWGRWQGDEEPAALCGAQELTSSLHQLHPAAGLWVMLGMPRGAAQRLGLGVRDQGKQGAGRG